MNLKMTPQLERVLRVFLENPGGPRYGYELMKAAKLASGTLYPLLTRLEGEQVVTSQWETPSEDGQRPRRYYQLTGAGAVSARQALAVASDSDRAYSLPRLNPAGMGELASPGGLS
jgi:DNA-binding PadR family transcriptional regulator